MKAGLLRLQETVYAGAEEQAKIALERMRQKEEDDHFYGNNYNNRVRAHSHGVGPLHSAPACCRRQPAHPLQACIPAAWPLSPKDAHILSSAWEAADLQA
jgi:hypothetical protein